MKNVLKVLGMGAVLAVLLLLSGCASAQANRDQQRRINELMQSRMHLEMFHVLPLEDEMTLGTFQGTLEKRTSPQLSQEEAQAFNDTRMLPAFVELPVFYPHEGAALLLTQASRQFPDIDLEDLDVRALEMTDVPSWTARLNPNQIPFTNPPRFELVIVSRVPIRGEVVRRSPNL